MVRAVRFASDSGTGLQTDLDVLALVVRLRLGVARRALDGHLRVGDGLAFLVNDLSFDDALGERGGRKHERHGKRQDTPVQMGPHASNPLFADDPPPQLRCFGETGLTGNPNGSLRSLPEEMFHGC